MIVFKFLELVYNIKLSSEHFFFGGGGGGGRQDIRAA
jgi:hypothetical protein